LIARTCRVKDAAVMFARAIARSLDREVPRIRTTGLTGIGEAETPEITSDSVMPSRCATGATTARAWTSRL
jgi:hypothetical protein